MITPNDMKNAKKILTIYSICLGLIVMVYVYAGAVGWKFFGTNTEKWSPKGEKGYHK